MIIWIKPHSYEETALRATENTLKALQKGGSFVRDSKGELVIRKGWIAVNVVSASFVVSVSIQQGYAADAFCDYTQTNEQAQAFDVFWEKHRKSIEVRLLLPEEIAITAWDAACEWKESKQ